MAFVFSGLQDVGKVKVDIIFVPAIGADPRGTWTRPIQISGEDGHHRLDFAVRDKLESSAQTHLYDHLTLSERKLEIKSAAETDHKTSAAAYAEVEKLVGQYSIVDWGHRLLEVVRQHRKAQYKENRPILFICHSTGGTVVKQALSVKAGPNESDVAGMCQAVVFFATPHHGSNVLSQPEFSATVSVQLGLKWEMSESLRQEFTLRNSELEAHNYKFVKACVGTKIYSYAESVDTHLTVLSSNESGGDSFTKYRQCITDSRSSRLGTADTPIEVEEFVQLNTTHTDTPKFTDEEGLYGIFLDEMRRLIGGYSDYQRTAFQALNKSIMSSVVVDVHQFYGEAKAMKLLSAHPTLEEFLEAGPTQCMQERIRGSDQKERPSVDDDNRSVLEMNASKSVPPAVRVTSVDEDNMEISPTTPSTSLPAPKLSIPENIHTRRPALNPEPAIGTSDHLAPNTKRVQFQGEAMVDTDRKRRPQKPKAFKLPGKKLDRFKWIHIPFNHSGWVPHVLTTISQDKGDLSLHSKLLLDKIWSGQHNRSRHASPHARFVKPSVKFLFPDGMDRRSDAFANPSSASSDIQFAMYLPYLHWDSFGSFQKRATIIKKRREQPDPKPILPEVAQGKSLEQKVIWQYLTSDRPLHCRRSLDQYGYPSLRNTTVRDGDQILYKRTRPNVDEPPKGHSMSHLHGVRSSLARHSNLASGDGAAKILMVDQLWIFIVEGGIIATFFTSKEREDNDNGLSRECDIRSQIYQDINGDYASECADPFDFAALCVSHAVKALLNDASDRNLQVFRIFEEYISILTERLTSSFKEFRNNHQIARESDTQAARHVDNRQDLDALLELRDIEDELNTIDKLIKEQQSCINDMLTQYLDLNQHHGKGLKGTNYLQDVASFLTESKDQVDGMLKSAQAAQQAFKELLDMKQKQANVVEAHLAREQTEVATGQSRSVLIFTIVTIIFLPLSFFASVFGINSSEWNPDGNNLPLRQIFTYMVCISLAVIIVALLVAFSRHARRFVQFVWKKTAHFALNLWHRKTGSWHNDDPFGDDDDSTVVGSNSSRVKRTSTDHHDPRGSLRGLQDLERAQWVETEHETKRLSIMSRSWSKLHLADEGLWAKERNGSVGY